VRAAHWGIYAEEHDIHRRRPEAPIGVSIVCSGQDEASLRPVLDALAACVRLEENILIFLDDTAVENHLSVWKHAERLGLLDHLSIIADMESRRELVLETDVLVLPEALGEVRSIVLDAMACGIVVVALADPFIEVTATPDLALLVDAPTEDAWLAALKRVTSDPDEMARIGARARERVITDRPAHRQVDAILAAYRELTDNPSIAFPG
jgi:glycosyltransferase involved in cell wall biosynthesis